MDHDRPGQVLNDFLLIRFVLEPAVVGEVCELVFRRQAAQDVIRAQLTATVEG